MNRISTFKIFKAKKLLLISLCFVSFYFANAGDGHPVYGTQPVYVQDKTIKCYPNPASSFINFEFKSEMVGKDNSFQIYNFTGKKMYETPLTSEKIALTLSNDFYRGLYIYQLKDKTGKIIETGKFQVIK